MNVTGKVLARYLKWLATSRPSRRRGSRKCTSSITQSRTSQERTASAALWPSASALPLSWPGRPKNRQSIALNDRLLVDDVRQTCATGIRSCPPLGGGPQRLTCRWWNSRAKTWAMVDFAQPGVGVDHRGALDLVPVLPVGFRDVVELLVDGAHLRGAQRPEGGVPGRTALDRK